MNSARSKASQASSQKVSTKTQSSIHIYPVEGFALDEQQNGDSSRRSKAASKLPSITITPAPDSTRINAGEQQPKELKGSQQTEDYQQDEMDEAEAGLVALPEISLYWQSEKIISFFTAGQDALSQLIERRKGTTNDNTFGATHVGSQQSRLKTPIGKKHSTPQSLMEKGSKSISKQKPTKYSTSGSGRKYSSNKRANGSENVENWIASPHGSDLEESPSAIIPARMEYEQLLQQTEQKLGPSPFGSSQAGRLFSTSASGSHRPDNDRPIPNPKSREQKLYQECLFVRRFLDLPSGSALWQQRLLSPSHRLHNLTNNMLATLVHPSCPILATILPSSNMCPATEALIRQAALPRDQLVFIPPVPVPDVDTPRDNQGVSVPQVNRSDTRPGREPIASPMPFVSVVWDFSPEYADAVKVWGVQPPSTILSVRPSVSVFPAADVRFVQNLFDRLDLDKLVKEVLSVMLLNNWAASFQENPEIREMLISVIKNKRIVNVFAEQVIIHSKLPSLWQVKANLPKVNHPCLLPTVNLYMNTENRKWLHNWVAKDPQSRHSWIVKVKGRDPSRLLGFKQCLCKDREEVRVLFEKIWDTRETRSTDPEAYSDVELELQAYLDDPLLVGGKKFDMQLTFLVCRNFDNVVIYNWAQPQFRSCIKNYYVSFADLT